MTEERETPEQELRLPLGVSTALALLVDYLKPARARLFRTLAERSGSDSSLGAGQHSWLGLGREKQTLRRPETFSIDTARKMYIEHLKDNRHARLHADGELRARQIPTVALYTNLTFVIVKTLF